MKLVCCLFVLCLGYALALRPPVRYEYTGTYIFGNSDDDLLYYIQGTIGAYENVTSYVLPPSDLIKISSIKVILKAEKPQKVGFDYNTNTVTLYKEPQPSSSFKIEVYGSNVPE